MAKRLEELLGKSVIFASDVVGEDAKAKAAALQPGQIMLLENLRFEKGEEKNDPAFAKALADLAGADGVYVSDAFGTVHRAHASTAGVADYLPAVSGFLIQKELEIIGGALANPKRPLVAILGGSKVSSKIGVINNLLEIADTIIIGGGMAYTFAAAQGGKIGDLSAGGRLGGLRQRDGEEGRRQGRQAAAACGHRRAPTPSPPTPRARWSRPVRSPTAGMGLDIGPETVKLYCGAVAGRGHRHLERPHGRVRVPRLCQGHRGGGRGPEQRRTPSPSSAAATPRPPCSSWAMPTR